MRENPRIEFNLGKLVTIQPQIHTDERSYV